MDEHGDFPRFPSWRMILGTACAFLIIALLAYGQSLGNGFVRWDDGLLIVENPIVRGRSVASLLRAFTTFDPELYIPVTFLSYKFDHALGGVEPFVYHVDSLVLHVLNALLVTLLAHRLLKRDRAALGVGLLFLLHPLHVEAVAWASGRKDLLSTAFALGSMLAYLSYRRDGSRAAYGWSVGLFALGLGSKVMVITLPLWLLLLDEWTSRPRTKAMLIDKIPYCGLSLLFGLIAVFGKTAVLAESTLLEKILMAGRSALFYPWKLAWPTGLSVLYPHSGAIELRDPAFLVPLLVTGVLALASVWLVWRRSRWSVAGIGVLLYLIAVSPTFINFAKGEGDLYVASDRYAYWPSIGLLLALGAALAALDRYPLPRKAIAGVLGVVLLGLGWLTRAQALVWKDTETLFAHVIEHQPDSYIAHANLGNAHRRAGRDDEAIAAFEKSLAIRPHPRTLSNLGAVHRKQGKIDASLAAYGRALEIDANSKEAHFGLGIVLAGQGKLAEAEREYRRAVEIDPSYGEAHTNLGSLLLKRGRTAEAEQEYRLALAADPFIADTHYNLGVLLGKLGRNGEAIDAYAAALSLQPDMIAARLNMGVLLYNRGDREAAERQFRRVLQLQPENAAARRALEQMDRM
jgi:protein O-mannosyl-transferase